MQGAGSRVQGPGSRARLRGWDPKNLGSGVLSDGRTVQHRDFYQGGHLRHLERGRVCVRDRESVGERVRECVCVCVCVCVCQRGSVCERKSERVCVRERGRVCFCEREVACV